MIQMTSQLSRPDVSLLSILICLMLLNMQASGESSGQAAATAGIDSKGEMSRAPTTALLSVEFRGPCGSPTVPSSLGDIVAATAHENGLATKLLGQASLVSREALEYSIVRSVGEVSHRTGLLFMEAGPGSELTVKTNRGEDVVVKADLTSVCWDVDTESCVHKAKEARADRLLLAKVHAEDLTHTLDCGLRVGHQRSVRVSLTLNLIDLATGNTIGIFSKERRQMDVSVQGAVDEAARSLASEGLKSLGAEGGP